MSECCSATKQDGTPCMARPVAGSDRCRRHQRIEVMHYTLNATMEGDHLSRLLDEYSEEGHGPALDTLNIKTPFQEMTLSKQDAPGELLAKVQGNGYLTNEIPVTFYAIPGGIGKVGIEANGKPLGVFCGVSEDKSDPEAVSEWRRFVAEIEKRNALVGLRTPVCFLSDSGAALQRPASSLVPSLDFIAVDSSLLYHQFSQAVATRAFITRDGEKWPVADLTTGNKTLVASAEIRPSREEEATLSDPELSVWQQQVAQQVLNMDDLTADVLDCISALWLQQADHPEASVTITADNFLQFRGLKPQKSGTGRRGGYKEELRQEIAQRISALDSTWITVAEMEVTELSDGHRGAQRKRVKYRGESRAVVVTSRAGQVTLSGRLDAFSWRLRPGDVFARFLIGPGRQTALLSTKALQYDPYRQKWEKRLTRYLNWQWRIRQARGSYLDPFTVATLLEEAVRDEIDPKHPIRTKERLEKALDTLHGDGIIAAWQYAEGYNAEIVGRPGWWREWLGWKLAIEPPQKVMDQYASRIPLPPAAKPKALPAGDADPIPSTVKKARQERELTQMQAAEEIGIDQATLSRIERGQKKPAPDTLKKLRHWLENPV